MHTPCSRRRFTCLAAACLLLALSAVLGAEQGAVPLELTGEAIPRILNGPSTGGGFELDGRIEGGGCGVTSMGPGFSLFVAGKQAVPCACVCGGALIFTDGFESGDTSRWSSSKAFQTFEQRQGERYEEHPVDLAVGGDAVGRIGERS